MVRTSPGLAAYARLAFAEQLAEEGETSRTTRMMRRPREFFLSIALLTPSLGRAHRVNRSSVALGAHLDPVLPIFSLMILGTKDIAYFQLLS